MQPVPHHSGVVLLLDLGPGVDQHAAGHVAVDLEPQDVLGVVGRLSGAVGELDPAGLHASPGQDLRLDHGRPADPLGDLTRSVGTGGEPEVADWDACALDDLAGLVLEEPHAV